jgi:hypothetical protein
MDYPSRRRQGAALPNYVKRLWGSKGQSTGSDVYRRSCSERRHSIGRQDCRLRLNGSLAYALIGSTAHRDGKMQDKLLVAIPVAFTG